MNMLDNIGNRFKLFSRNKKISQQKIEQNNNNVNPFLRECNEKEKTQDQINELFDKSNIIQQVLIIFANAIPNINFKMYNKKNSSDSVSSAIVNLFNDINDKCFNSTLGLKIDFYELINAILKSYIYQGKALIYCSFVGDEIESIGMIDNFDLMKEAGKYPKISGLSFTYNKQSITMVDKSDEDDGSKYVVYDIYDENSRIEFYPIIFNISTKGEAQTPLYSVLKHLEIYQEHLNTANAIFKNQAQPSMVVAPESTTKEIGLAANTQQQQNVLSQISNKVREMLQGSKKQGNVVVLPMVDGMKYNVVLKHPTISETYDIEMAEKLATEVAMLLGIPPGIIVPQRTFANAAEDTKNRGYATLQIVQKVLNGFTKQVVYSLAQLYGEIRYFDYIITFDNTDILDIKESERKEVIALTQSGMMYINEGREEIGLDPVPDGNIFMMNNKSNNNES